jgi:ethanolamine utilization protein EutA
MHDAIFEHVHASEEERRHLSQVIWEADNVELTTVGIDIGSSTSHLMIARVHLQRLATGLSSRFVVVERRILWRSPIALTPYAHDRSIDAHALGRFIGDCFAAAGIAPATIDTGAVILTGEALKRHNARAIADLFAGQSGKFVCASAGHHLEAAMAAHGSGAVALSRARDATILNVDIGGGTTKLALIERGRLLASAAVAVGGRLIATDGVGRILRLEEPGAEIAAALGLPLAIGAPLDAAARARLTQRMAVIVTGLARGRIEDALARRLMVTEGLPAGLPAPDAISFSGGVAEFLFGRDAGDYGDLGPALAQAIAREIADAGLGSPVCDPGEGIRATVIGASQFSMQVSGNTILVSHPDRLPLRNLPVVAVEVPDSEILKAPAIADLVSAALIRCDRADGTATALALAWHGSPSHERLAGVAHGIAAALPATLASGEPLVLLVDRDVWRSLGRVLATEVAPGAAIVALDGLRLADFDYVDVGEVMAPAGVVTIIIKSLLF